MDICNGLQRLLNLLPPVQLGPAAPAGMEVCRRLLRFTIHPGLCILFHPHAGAWSSIWFSYCKTTPLYSYNPNLHFILLTTYPPQLWCWVSKKWNFLRIALFYGPVWFVISLTFAIYLRAGSSIYQKRREVRALSGLESLDTEIAVAADLPHVHLAGIQVTSEIACSTPQRYSVAVPDVDVDIDVPRPARSFSSSNISPYSVTIEGGMIDPISMYQNSEEQLSSIRPSSSRKNSNVLRSEMSMTLETCRSDGVETYETYSQRRGINREATSAAWAYTKYAMLFFIALLVTWVCFLLPAL